MAKETQKAQAAELLAAGKSVRFVARTTGLAEKTVRGVRNEAGTTPEPATVLGVKEADPTPKPSGRTLGEVLNLPFLGMSIFFGPGWELTIQERGEMGSSMAASLPYIPTPVMDKLDIFLPFLTLSALLLRAVRVRLQTAQRHAETSMQGMPSTQEVIHVSPPASDGSLPDTNLEPRDAPVQNGVVQTNGYSPFR